MSDPTRKELWRDMTGCECPKPDRRKGGVRKADVCSPRNICCNGRLNAIRKQYKKYGYTWGPPR